MSIPCPPPDAVSEEMLAGDRRIVPQEPKGAIAVVAYNELALQDARTAEEMNSRIPFLGYLMGMAFDGHTVVVFEGHPSALKTGCQNSDILIVDEAMADLLQEDWVPVAAGVMKDPRTWSSAPTVRSQNWTQRAGHQPRRRAHVTIQETLVAVGRGT